jgi:retinol dehydrogenase-12
MKENIVIITGANTGIGKESAIELSKSGAHIVMACRDKSRAEIAIEEIKNVTGLDSYEFMELDLMDLQSVKNFTIKFLSKHQRLDVLVNNAGIMALPKRATTKQGLEAQFGTNHIGHFLLTTLLLDLMKKSKQARIINVSSLAHEKGVINFDDL